MRDTRLLGTGLVFVLVACTAQAQAPEDTGADGLRGGVLRVGVAGDPTAPRYLDPQTAYSAEEWGLLRLSVRTLLSYNGRAVEEGGLQLRPDLATAAPDVSPDRMTWTFHIKPGLYYAPPLDNVEITAADFVRALERTATLPNPEEFGYSFYYSVIEGFDRFAAGDADSIAGLETPDRHTLVVHLAEPSTNLASLFALHATSPLPPDPDDPDARLGMAEGHTQDYATVMVSSGPYMLEDPPVDLSQGEFALVRNPSWEPSTDPLRGALVDRIQVIFAKEGAYFPGEGDVLVEEVDEGRLDILMNVDHSTPAVERFLSDPATRDRVLEIPGRNVWYAVMNLALPPFDDIHVRKALTHAIDRKRVAELVTDSGTAPAVPFAHVAADSLEDNLLLDYRPYGTPDFGADLARARAEMARSRYDSDGDGRCDHAACRNLEAPSTYPFGPAIDAIAADLAAIGIEIRSRVLSQEAFYGGGGTSWPDRRLALAIGNGWVDDAASAETWFDPLFNSESSWFFTTALLGASPKQLERWGYRRMRVPNVDARIDACKRQVGHRQLRCWAELDAYLMEKVLPFAPIIGGRIQRIVSERVVEHSIDALTTYPALDRFAVNEREP